MLITYFNSPIGFLRIEGTETHITDIQFVEDTIGKEDYWVLGEEAKKQLTEYFAAQRTKFDLPLQPKGTAFQQSVWQALQQIPLGETRSYGEIAKAIGKPKAARAIGQANNRNPIAIVIPCHRVIGSNGQLTGYAGGLERKEYLLKLEQNL